MCKELDEILESNQEYATKLVIGMIKMGADACQLPVEVDGDHYTVSIKGGYE